MELLTQIDKEKLEAQLAELVALDKVLADRIAEARAHGDLRENAEYHASREAKALNDSRMRVLRKRLATAHVVDASEIPADMVFLGSIIEIRDEDRGSMERLRIVATLSDEDHDDYREVSGASPMGIALMKMRIGDTVRVDLPRGTRRLTIVSISC
ncbi:MAG: GreA/GreB family elongation factor [Planctomycetota bacterium]|nr:GreA/GreB family elongation factor [Planctomycetota bacterium]MDA1105763.1 GreA/GreB family elongation factor [Planctomycetota bacterium]